MRNLLLRSSFILPFLAFSLIACQGKNNENPPAVVVPKDSLIQLLKDIHTVDAASKQNFIPNNAENLYKYKEFKFVLEKHGVSKARFDSTLSYYSSNASEFETLYEDLIKSMKEDEIRLEKLLEVK